MDDLTATVVRRSALSQTWDVEIVTRKVEYRLSRRRCGRYRGFTTAATSVPGQSAVGRNRELRCCRIC